MTARPTFAAAEAAYPVGASSCVFCCSETAAHDGTCPRESGVPPCPCGKPAAVVSFLGPIGRFWRQILPNRGGFAGSWCGDCAADMRFDVVTVPAPRSVRS